MSPLRSRSDATVRGAVAVRLPLRPPSRLRKTVGPAALAAFLFHAAARAEPVVCPDPQARAPAAAPRALEVADAIATTRVMSVMTSPDTGRVAIATITGDVARNGIWLDIYAGPAASLDALCALRRIGRLFTRATGDLGPPYLTFNNPIVWGGNGRLLLLWPDAEDRQQVVEVDLATGRVRYRTSHPTNVINFKASPTGGLFFTAEPGHDEQASRDLIAHGFAVTNDDVYSLMRGHADGYGMLDRVWNRDYFYAAPGARRPRRLTLNGLPYALWSPGVVEFSPDGRQLIVSGSPETIPVSWRHFRSGNYITQGIEEAATVGRTAFLARQVAQLYLVDLATLRVRPVADLPNADRLAVKWSPSGRELLVGPTFLPGDDADPAATMGRAVAIVDPRTGRYVRVGPPDIEVGPAPELEWLDQDRIRVRSEAGERRFRRTAAGWALAEVAAIAPTPAAISFRIAQDANMPPTIIARDRRSGDERSLLDPNPGLSQRFRLGRVEGLSWQDASGRTWRGRLYLPVDYRADRRFPLVIQTHGFTPLSEFSLYGKGPASPGLGPGFSIYAAQVLANRNIAVLQTDNVSARDLFGSPREADAAMAAYEGAIRALDARGLIDDARVGLAGFSRTGWHVEHALAHSGFRFAAAIASDNFDGSYMQSLLIPGDSAADAIGAPAFGPGLRTWFERSPAFNADRITTPLRLQLESGGMIHALSHWEMFSRLRRLGRPVELYIVPDIERGSHALQNPRQVLASQDGAIDWFDFWLNGREDPRPAKREQYLRWRGLRDRLRGEAASTGPPPGQRRE